MWDMKEKSESGGRRCDAQEPRNDGADAAEIRWKSRCRGRRRWWNVLGNLDTELFVEPGWLRTCRFGRRAISIASCI